MIKQIIRKAFPYFLKMKTITICNEISQHQCPIKLPDNQIVQQHRRKYSRVSLSKCANNGVNDTAVSFGDDNCLFIYFRY